MTKKVSDTTNITWVCSNCGNRYGKHNADRATWHYGTCDVCGKDNLPVTEPRDFGEIVLNLERIQPKKTKEKKP